VIDGVPGMGRVATTLPPPTPIRAEYRVQQSYRYEYPSPVHNLAQRLVMLPPETHGPQRLLRAELRVEGAADPRTRWSTDRFGNVVYQITSPGVTHAVEFTAEFTVQRYVTAECYRVSDAQCTTFLPATALTAPSLDISNAARAIAREVATADPDALLSDLPGAAPGILGDAAMREWSTARRAGLWAAGALTYQFGITGVQTPAAMALHFGRGVCQDYAHLAIALLRELQIPARYVSGHLPGEGAPHAWIEVLLPDPELAAHRRVVAYDPTHRATPGLDYVTVAVGRDYADITPTSGTFQGAMGRFTSAKRTWVVDHA
jgi:transglutaminase-like putative cysteine protease